MEPKVERYYLMPKQVPNLSGVERYQHDASRWSYPPTEMVEARGHRYWWKAVDEVVEGIPDKGVEIEIIGGLESVEGVRSHLTHKGFTNVTSSAEKTVALADRLDRLLGPQNPV